MRVKFYEYYRSLLTGQELIVYDTLYTAFEGLADQVKVPVLDIHRLSDIFWKVTYDHPAIYYIDSFSYTIFPGEILIYIKYLYTKNEILQIDQRIDAGMESVKKAFFSKPMMSTFQKEVIIHDCIVMMTSYDYETLEKQKHNLPLPAYQNSICGPLLHRKDRCGGIAKTFKFFCDYYQIPCIYVLGNAPTSHAWNIVKIDKQYYHMDATWDIKEKGDISFRYDYFNMSDALLEHEKTHFWNKADYPKCPSNEMNYYNVKKLFVKNLSDIDFLIGSKFKGQKYICFKFASMDLPDNNVIIDYVKAAIYKHFGSCSYTWSISRNKHNVYVQIKD